MLLYLQKGERLIVRSGKIAACLGLLHMPTGGTLVGFTLEINNWLLSRGDQVWGALRVSELSVPEFDIGYPLPLFCGASSLKNNENICNNISYFLPFNGLFCLQFVNLTTNNFGYFFILALFIVSQSDDAIISVFFCAKFFSSF